MIRISRPYIASTSQSDLQTIAAARKENKELLINQLKASYKQHYDAWKPVPFSQSSGVNKAFVDVGIDIQLGSWVSLGPCRLGLGKALNKYKRLIIVGYPGYGSSMLATQCTYEWCNGTQESYFKDVEILILIRLRQVGKTHSFYKAIKKVVLPRESTLNEQDVKTVLESSPSVLVILDGLDEYLELDKDTSEIMKIIAGEICPQLQVITTTRYMPKIKAPQTARLRLTGLCSKAQEEYLRKTVVGDDVRVVLRLKERLQENHLLEDLCEVPFFFVMLAHLSHAGNDFRACNTLTNVFQLIVKCLHSFAKRKGTGTITKKAAFWKFEDDHRKLDEIAFKGLSGRDQHTRWRKEILREKLGKKFYEQYVQIGVLVEEEAGYQTEVRFYHKIFCEWYAAHYLAADRFEVEESLENMHPCDLQYFYRFVCGLYPNIARNVIERVKTVKGGDLVAVMCISELQGQVKDILDSVTDLCSREIKLDKRQSKYLQRCLVHLLEIASTAKIPVSSLELRGCLRSVNVFSGNLHLQIPICIPSLSFTTVKQLWIEEEGKEFTENEIADILKYAEMWLQLRSLWFRYCLLPWSFKAKSGSVLQSRMVEVFWIPDFAGTIYTLKSEGSKCMWKHGGGILMKEEYQREVETFQQYERKQTTYC